MIPPLSMWLHIESPGHRRVRLWLPLFLVWLILLPLMVLVMAIAIVVDVGLYVAGQSYHHYTLLLLGVLEVLADTRGTVVRVYGTDAIVNVTIS